MNSIGEWAQAALEIFEEESILIKRVHRDCGNNFAQVGDRIIFDSQRNVVLNETLCASFIIRDNISQSFFDLTQNFLRSCIQSIAWGIDRLIVKSVYNNLHVDTPRLPKLNSVNARELVDQVSNILDNYLMPIDNRSLVLDPYSGVELSRGGVNSERRNLLPILYLATDELPKGESLAWHRDSVVLATRPLDLTGQHNNMPSGEQFCVACNDNISLRVTMKYDVSTAYTRIKFVILAGVVVFDPASIVVLNE